MLPVALSISLVYPVAALVVFTAVFALGPVVLARWRSGSRKHPALYFAVLGVAVLAVGLVCIQYVQSTHELHRFVHAWDISMSEPYVGPTMSPSPSAEELAEREASFEASFEASDLSLPLIVILAELLLIVVLPALVLSLPLRWLTRRYLTGSKPAPVLGGT